MNLGRKLLELRKERDLTQDEVGKAIGVNKSQVSQWEQGKEKPSLESLIGLAKLFSVSTDYLLFDNVPREGVEAINDFELYKEFRETEKLAPQDRNLVREVIKAILVKVRVKDVVANSEQPADEKAESKSSGSPRLRKVAGKR